MVALATHSAEGFSEADVHVAGPLGRTYSQSDLDRADVVLLCVPDREIAAACEFLAEVLVDSDAHPLVGHCSGAGTLELLSAVSADRRFSLHPLTSVTAEQRCNWQDVTAAVAGSGAEALQSATQLARLIGMSPLEIRDEDRAAYHAAASIASNFLVTLEAAAERLGKTAGVPRQAILPLVRQTVENWAGAGERALTGPIARGDFETVERQRHAVAERAPELLDLFEAMARATRDIAGEPVPA
jgi:predicted short-subunit dehydrogenase-like oxidoreductase (DUF2520 family)